MTRENQQGARRKLYERPEIRRVKLEAAEATLGTGCHSSVSAAEFDSCAEAGPCVLT